MTYIAIIGDIISSKKIEQRPEVQKKLQRILEEINTYYASVITSPFTITTGDEFQALLLPNSIVFKIIDTISMQFQPYQIRFGIGLGSILTDINPQQSIGADGPAYWQARSAINYIHDKNDYGINHLAVSLDDSNMTEYINAVLSACEFIKSKWTTSQYEILEGLLKEGIYEEKFSHKNMAQLLGLSPSSFNKRLKSSGLKIYLRNKKLASDLLLKAFEKKKGEVKNDQS
ncbi:SatD family protein [Streptococcus macacae]|uniref:SatD protein n=1 Tax=Streptococcus macacae NCTC 11558 TaxID=764298 RepID=G5JUB2_9STRE|nr:SatD family protein [Streptococcus macacae]EHJ52955.1 SatD protein [Streptococcus macacae NCTC 11558]SUN78475.1 putative satD protein [Streptococcus macacae NCTC 11558]